MFSQVSIGPEGGNPWSFAVGGGVIIKQESPA